MFGLARLSPFQDRHPGRLTGRLAVGADVMSEIRTGKIAESIAAAVVVHGGDLVVMSTHGRTGISHLLLGVLPKK